MTTGTFTTDEEIEIAREGLVPNGAIATIDAWKEHHGRDWVVRTGTWCFDKLGRRCFSDVEVQRADAEKAFPLSLYLRPPRPLDAALEPGSALVVAAARRLGLVPAAAGSVTVDVALLLEEMERRATKKGPPPKTDGNAALARRLIVGANELGLRATERDPASVLEALIAVARLGLQSPTKG
jgi:hypothetical protein